MGTGPTLLTEFNLDGRVVLVTGGGDGLGRQMTEAFVDAGARVVICGRRVEALDRTVDELSGRAPIRPIQADVTDPDQVAHLAQAVGDVDVLVNNAGGSVRSRWTETTPAQWRAVMTLNLEAPLWLCQQFVPGMVERGWGRVVNVASIYGVVAGDTRRYPGLGLDTASYFASKHAVIGLTKYLAVSVARTGVTVNALCPGMFPTSSKQDSLSPEIADALRDGTPMGRLGSDSDLRAAVLFLAGPGSSFVTGQSLIVDGGWTVW